MIKLTIGNSYSKITGLSPKLDKELRALLSYTVGGSAAFFSGYGVRKKCLVDKVGNFPTGLLHRALNFLMPLAMQNMVEKVFDVVDLRKKPQTDWPPRKPGTYEDAYTWQKEALAAAIDEGRGIISATTGSGKSRVIGLIASALNVKTLIVVPSLEIRKQLRETLKDLKNVTVLNIDSPKLKTAKDFDCLIIDEAHHAAAKTYRMLNKTAWQGIYYRFYLTATPFRNDVEEQLLFESIAGQIIYQLTYKQAVANNYVVPVEAYYFDLPKQETDAYTWAEVYSALVVNNEYRNQVIADMLLALQNGKASGLCLVKEVKHGRILADLTGLPFITGADDDSRAYISQFNSGELKAVIATTGVMGEGVDTKACEWVIIAGLGKAKSQFMQQVGRAIRTYPGKESAKVVLFRDKSHKFMLKHFREQAKILKLEYGIRPIKLELE